MQSELTERAKTAWDSNHEGYRAIFNAAIAGICANPNFFGSTMQGAPEAAVHFANEVTLAAIYGDKYVPVHARQEVNAQVDTLVQPVACDIADPSARDCDNMKEVGGGMDGERYRCDVCGKGYFLDYEEMK